MAILKLFINFVESYSLELYGNKSENAEPKNVDDAKNFKTILYWNEAYGSTKYGFCCGQDPFIEYQCPYTNCYVTDNRSHIRTRYELPF